MNEIILIAGGWVIIVYFYAILIAAYIEGANIPNPSEFI